MLSRRAMLRLPPMLGIAICIFIPIEVIFKLRIINIYERALIIPNVTVA